MNTTKFVPWAVSGLCVLFAACSGGSDGSDAAVTVESVVQDLDVDPDGTTTVITLSRAINSIDEANIDSDGSQTPLTATLVDDTITVVWSARVTPQNEVRIVSKDGVSSAFASVTTTDAAAPTFVVSDATQMAGLGGDVITLSFSGARVIESEAESASKWVIEVGGEIMDLTGSTFVMDVANQELEITTGPDCNLHADFDISAVNLHSVADVALASTAVAGSATGDTTAPSLVSVEQNLSEDEYGRVVDLTFDEAMDPVFAALAGNFVGAGSDLAISVEQPSEDVLRVVFNNPMVPGVDQITLENLVDAHGNSFADQTVAIDAGSTLANDFAQDPELLTVSGASNDTITVLFDQALDPDNVADAGFWELEVDGNPYDLSGSTFTYDLLDKTLVVTLSDDVDTGDSFDLQAALATPPLDVDGEDFVASFSGTITGDSGAPTISSMIQNRNVDPTGKTVDVVFSEVLDESSAENVANWASSNANVVDATLLANGVRVRIELDQVAVPGDDTLDCDGVEDLAGNTMTAVLAHALTSNDLREPEGLSATATAIEGSDNDTLVVVFTDDMVESDVEDPANWSVESPIGSALDVSSASIDYVGATRTATLTFDSATAIALQTDDDFQVGWTTMRDIGGNAISVNVLDGDIDAEVTLPTVVSAWVDSLQQNILHVRFSEPCQDLDDVSGTSVYEIETAGGTLRGVASAATVDADSMGVELTFGFAIAAASDVLNVSGVRDACGNPCFSVESVATEVEDAAEVALDTGNSTVTTVSGERNDTLEFVFDRRPSPWQLLDPDHYALEDSGNPVDLSGATFSYDGDLTVTVVLDAVSGPNLSTGTTYDLSISGIQSAQGVDMSSASTDSIAASGDSSAPALPAGAAKLDASSSTDTILIEMSEAISEDDASDTANILLNGTTNPDSAELLGFRTVRATFSGGVALGDTVQVDFHDLAGNLGSVSRTVSAADVAGPLVSAVAGYAVSGSGGDYVEVTFSKQIDLASGLSNSNYSLTNGSTVFDLSNCVLAWNSATSTVTLYLGAAGELDVTQGITVDVSDVYDLAGNAMSPAASLNGTIGGDSTAPDFLAAFVNLHEDAGGTILDVLFDEEVSEAFALTTSQWTLSGGQTVMQVEHRAEGFWRITLSSAYVVGDTLDMLAVPDLAGNVSGAISIQPLD